MIFLDTQDTKHIKKYIDYLKAIGAFSNLFSSSDKPFIQYRVAENTFCKAFNAINLARADVAYDAIIDGHGIGIKTFILSGNSNVEKIAEFNALSAELRTLNGLELARKLADLRNDRIEVTDRIYDLNSRSYHIIGRDSGIIKIFETPYDLIDKDSIEIIGSNQASLKFKDARNEYNFNYSKSVLMKRFVVPENTIEIEIEIIDEPIDVLLGLVGTELQPSSVNIEANHIETLEIEELTAGKDYVILPLYSPSAKGHNKEPIVPLKSQLNLWNAGGRKRDPGEVYIPIPKLIHRLAPGFLPQSEVVFNLKIPSGEILTAKVCQEGDKALMTNPNNAMSDWILRKVLRLKEQELLDYDILKRVGFDSVKITKMGNEDYLIDFAQLDEYENFIQKMST